MKKPEQLWFDICHRFAEQSKCMTRQIGCVLVRDDHMLLQGFNGAPKGSDCKDCPRPRCKGLDEPSGGSLELAICAHAEANLIGLCAKYGISSDGCTLYCTNHPCSECAKLIERAGIKEVVYEQEYASELASLIFKNAGIVVRKFNLANVDQHPVVQHPISEKSKT